MKSTIGFLRQVLDQQNEELREINDNLNEFVEKIERGNRVLEKAIRYTLDTRETGVLKEF